MMHRTIRRLAWVLVPVSLIFLLTSGAFQTLHALWVDWADTTYVHGYLVAAISAGLLLIRAREVPREAWRPALSWTPLLIGLASAWLFSSVAGIQFLEYLLLPPLLGAAILVTCGAAVARRTAFAVGYLWFATDVWQVINPLLQWTTVYASRLLLRIVGIPAHFNDNTVQIPAGTFEIAGGCSGLHFFVVALALAALLGELRRDSLRRRVRLLLLAGLIAAAVNWVRVSVLVMIGHFTHMQHPFVSRSHYWFGWVLFAGALVLFLLIERFVSADAVIKARPEESPRPAGPVWSGAATVAVVVASLMLWRQLASRPYTGEFVVAAAPAGWQLEKAGDPEWQPVFHQIDFERVESWGISAMVVDRYTGLYRIQFQGKEFSAYGNAPRGSGSVEGWRFREHYFIGTRTFRSPIQAQVWYAVRALTFLRAPASRVEVLRSACNPDCETAEVSLDAWND